MQTSAMKACFQIAECSLSSTKIMQTSAMKACFQIAECSLSSTKIKRIIQISKKLLKKLILPSPFLAFSLSPLHQNIDDDGGTEQRGDGIQGDDATARREGAEEIAEKGKD